MLPRDLKPEQFADYAPEGRKFVTSYLGVLRQLPLSFVPGLLRELINYDFKFPAERKAHEGELACLSSLSPVQIKEWFQELSEIQLSPQLEAFDWPGNPVQFVEQLSAHLWATHQLDAFRRASNDYADRLRLAVPPAAPVIPRMGITVVGQGVESYSEPLFSKLRAHGAYFSRLNPEEGLRRILNAVEARAQAHPEPYQHWYIDGGDELAHSPIITCVSYKALEPARAALLSRMELELKRPGMGPEALRTVLAQLTPSDLGMGAANKEKQQNEVLDRFQLSLLTEGSGTQIYSTSFAQWAAREALRRAQPLTLLVRFAPRQRQKPMNELLSAATARTEFDFVGSLIDADFGAYYNWLNQQRLPGAEASSFVVWFEGHGQALAIGPSMPRGTESTSIADLGQLLAWTV